MTFEGLIKKHFFTSKMCCQISQQISANQLLTVAVELIPRVDGKNVFEDKIAMQLSNGEVANLLDVLLMYRAEFNPKYHGTQKDKLLLLRNQHDGLFVHMRQESKQYAYNFVIDEEYRYEILALVSKTLADRDGVQIKDVLDLSRTLAQRRAQINQGGKT